ncbi:hypothetical protein BSNK01_15270 [Bacillaceae bacterium]
MEEFAQTLQAFVVKYAYYVIFVLTACVYKLGFARKLPLFKSLIIYFLLALGCVPLTILYSFGLPVVGSLLVAVALLVIVRVSRKKSESE